MEIFTLLTPCSVQGCMQGGNNLVNTMELQRFPPCYKVVNTLYHLQNLYSISISMLHYNGFYIGEFYIWI